MARLISAIRRITVTNEGETCTLSFRTPMQSKLRMLARVCRKQDGTFDNDEFVARMTRESVEMLVDAEGARARFAGDGEFAVCAAMPAEQIQRVREYYERNRLELSQEADGWKGLLLTLFPDMFERAAAALWANQGRADDVPGK